MAPVNKGLHARAELGAFLRARRAELLPESLGLTRGARRLTPGLRREEVAALAEVGITWYTWLEQGRDINVSLEVLDRIAKALQLSRSGRSYLVALAGYSAPNSRPDDAGIAPAFSLALNAIETCPALIVNPRFDVLVANRLGAAVFEPEAYRGRFAQNMFWRAYMDPVRRDLYVDWNERLMNSLGLLRVNYASRVGDPSFEELLHALRSESPEFSRMWETALAESLAPAPIRLASRQLGRLNVWSTRLAIPESPGFLMLVYAPADKATFDKFAGKARQLRVACRHTKR